MTAQIIFFLAAALFIILLIRRVGWLPDSGRKLLGQLKGLGRLIAQVAQTLQANAAERAERKKAVPSARPERTVKSAQALPQSQFWQEEQLEDKMELSSHFEEGDALLKSGQFEEAEQFFLKAAAAHPNDAKVYAKLGLIYLNTKNYSDAIESLKVAAKIDKYNPSRHYNLALAYLGNKDLQHAIISAREAISLDPVTAKYRQFLDELLKGGDKVKLS